MRQKTLVVLRCIYSLPGHVGASGKEGPSVTLAPRKQRRQKKAGAEDGNDHPFSCSITCIKI